MYLYFNKTYFKRLLVAMYYSVIQPIQKWPQVGTAMICIGVATQTLKDGSYVMVHRKISSLRQDIGI